MPFPLIPLAMAAFQVGSSIVKQSKARKAEQEALDAMQSFERERMKNVYQDVPYYSEQSRKFAKDMISRNLSTVASAAAQQGGRLTGAIGKAQAQADMATRQQLAIEDQAYIDHQNRIAADNAWMRGETSRREDQYLQSLGNFAGVQNQNQNLYGAQAQQAIGAAAAYAYDWQKNGGTFGSGNTGNAGATLSSYGAGPGAPNLDFNDFVDQIEPPSFGVGSGNNYGLTFK